MSNMRKWFDLYEQYGHMGHLGPGKSGALPTESKKLTLEFPLVDSFEDYHDIDFQADKLSKLFKTRIRSTELSTDASGRYWGVFYVGKRPSKKAVANLLDNAGYEKGNDY